MYGARKLTIISVLICAVSLLYNFLSKKPAVDLCVAILSKRTNFDLRNAIRQTWIDKISEAGLDNHIRPFFVIGDHDCEIPDQLLRDPYSCEKWTFNYSEDLKTEIHSGEINLRDISKTTIFNGFSFKART